MSTIIATTLSNGSVSVPTDTVVNGSAKAWVTGNTDATLLDSFNVSSGVDNGTGDYTYNLTNAMADSNYAIPANVRSSGSINFAGTISVNSSSWQISVWNLSGTRNDRLQNHAVMGDLA